VHPVALLSFFIPSVFMLFCLISLHYVNGINKVMMMMMIKSPDELEKDCIATHCGAGSNLTPLS